VTDKQAQALLTALLRHVRDNPGSNVLVAEFYNGPLPDGCDTLTEAAIWLRLNIKSLKVRKP
jgi:hypothetical protein